jgi:hypothetical protein
MAGTTLHYSRIIYYTKGSFQSSVLIRFLCLDVSQIDLADPEGVFNILYEGLYILENNR